MTLARYRAIHVNMWGDEKFRRLTPLQPCGQGLWIYLLTNPDAVMIPGLYRAGELQMAEALGWDVKAFRKAFAESSREDMVKADWNARVVWIPNAVKYNPPQSPNVVVGWKDLWDEIPECLLKHEAWERLKGFLEAFGKAFGEAFLKACLKPLAKPLGKPLWIQDQDQDQDQDKSHAGPLEAGDPPAGEKRARKAPAMKTGPHQVRNRRGKASAAVGIDNGGASRSQQPTPIGSRPGASQGLQADPTIREVFDRFAKGFECRTGNKPAFSGGKFGAKVKALLKHRGRDQVLAYIAWWFETAEKWVLETGWSPDAWCSAAGLNKFLADGKAMAPGRVDSREISRKFEGIPSGEAKI